MELSWVRSIWLLGFAALAPALAAASVFDVGGFNCITEENVCNADEVAPLDAVIGLDTVYAPDGITPLYTLTDVTLQNAIGPNLASQIAGDSTQPVQLQENLGPFTTLTDLAFAENEQGFCNGTNVGELLTQGGSLVTLGGSDTPAGLESAVTNDLTGAVSGATVTSNVVSLFDSDVYSVDPGAGPGPITICGASIPAGYNVMFYQSIVVNSYFDTITETELSPASAVPEPSIGALLALVPLALAARREMRRRR